MRPRPFRSDDHVSSVDGLLCRCRGRAGRLAWTSTARSHGSRPGDRRFHDGCDLDRSDLTITSVPLTDYFSAVEGALGALLGLRLRDLTGQGQEIDVSMMDATSTVQI